MMRRNEGAKLRVTAAIAAALLSGAAVDSRPQPATAPTLDDAVTRLQAGDARKAAAMLETITQRQPDLAPAWRALGTARQKVHDYDGAAAALLRALEIEPDSPKVFYGLGAVYASKHDADRAFMWLQKARATRRIDMSQLTIDPDLASLRPEPRFNGLLPKPGEFDLPFVEQVRIIREWRGEAVNDQFGWIARSIGDVDGDGVSDVVTSAPTHGDGGSSAGRVYVYSTKSGRLLWSADGVPGDQLGTGVENAGDANHDGIADVIASGPGGTGVAYLFSGRDGRILQSFKSSNPDEMFGNHVSAAGDVNHDGYADVIIGAPGKDGEDKVPGHAYVYSGKDGSLLLSLTGERAGDGFGSAVAGTRTGARPVLVVGAPRAGPARHGRVYVYDSASGRLRFKFDADPTGNALGLMFVSAEQDFDRDGVNDVYASDWSNGAKGPSTGRIYVYSGASGKRLFTLSGEAAGDGFGTSASHAGDVDGDGYPDLIVGAWQNQHAAVSGGRAYLYSGRTRQLLRTYTNRVPGDTFGFDAVGLGDVDGDGTVDLLVTAGWSAANGYHSGRVFVISSGMVRAHHL